MKCHSSSAAAETITKKAIVWLTELSKTVCGWYSAVNQLSMIMSFMQSAYMMHKMRTQYTIGDNIL